MKHLLVLIVMGFFGCATVDEVENTSESESYPSASSKADEVSGEVTPSPWESEPASESQTSETTAGTGETASSGDNVTEPADEAETQGESEERETDTCTVFDLYGDGTCDRFCESPDPDCEGVEEPKSFCELVAEERDGFCHSSCGDMDPDCVDEANAGANWTMDQGLLEVCSRISLDNLVRELAESICVGANAPEERFNECVELCLDAYYDTQWDNSDW